ncbi:unnamed protein product, partial [Effrenium voratum]
PWHTHFLPEHSNPGASDFRNNRSCHGAPMVSARNISRGSASRPNLAASVVCPDGTQKDVLFDHRESFSEQVRKICQQLGVATNEEDEESFILTVASAGPVISSKADLANYLQHPSERLHLRRAAEVAESQLAAVKAGPRETALQQLLQAVKNESLRAEVVERDGIQLAVQDLLQNKDQAKLPLALLCELMNDESADTWLEDHEEDPDLGPPLFRQLLAMLFPEQDDSPDDNRHACLSILLSLLQKLPGAAGKCHKAIKEERDKEARPCSKPYSLKTKLKRLKWCHPLVGQIALPRCLELLGIRHWNFSKSTAQLVFPILLCSCVRHCICVWSGEQVFLRRLYIHLE